MAFRSASIIALWRAAGPDWWPIPAASQHRPIVHAGERSSACCLAWCGDGQFLLQENSKAPLFSNFRSHQKRFKPLSMEGCCSWASSSHFKWMNFNFPFLLWWCPLLVASDWSKDNSFRSNPRARTTPLMMCTLVLYTRCYRGPQHSFWNGHHGATAPDRTCGHLAGVGVQTVARSERGKIPLDSTHHLVCC